MRVAVEIMRAVLKRAERVVIVAAAASTQAGRRCYDLEEVAMVEADKATAAVKSERTSARSLPMNAGNAWIAASRTVFPRARIVGTTWLEIR